MTSSRLLPGADLVRRWRVSAVVTSRTAALKKLGDAPPQKPLFNWVHRGLARAATLIDMAIQQKNADQRHADLELMIEQFRVAEKRALIKRGVKLWTRAEAERARASVQTLEPDKIN